MSFLYTGAQLPYFRRCIKPGLMIPSISITVSGFGQLKMYILHFNVIQMKAVCSALKSLQDKFLHKRILIASDNTTVFGYLNKQKWGGGAHVSPSLAQLTLLQSLKYTHNRQTYSWLLKGHSQHHLQKG